MRNLSTDIQNIPVLRMLFPFVLGIGTGIRLGLSACRIDLILLSAFLLISCRILMPFRSGLFKFSISIFFYLAGILTYNLSVRPAPCFDDGEKVVVEGVKISQSILKNEKFRFEIEVTSIVSKTNMYFGKTILLTYVEEDFINDYNNQMRSCRFTGVLYRIRNNGNPGEFDYAGYMAGRECHYRFYPDSVVVSGKIDNPRNGIKHLALLVRNRIVSSWEGPDEELSILRAMVLGDKSGLSYETRQNYSDAGGMHILAVSGLHVGLIWWVLGRLLSFLKVIPGGKAGRSLIVILILWFYACMAGLSPSVCRSVTMFSIISFSSFISRRTGSLNGVLLSAFFLLIIDAAQIEQVGFQLSYLAVTGIITIQPMISGLFNPRNRLFRWLVDMTSVSLAAQIATAPLSVYYFHQLPVYFLITNLFAIPMLSLLIGLFIMFIPFFMFHFIERVVMWPLIKLSYLMNRLMEVVSGFPGSSITGLEIHSSQVTITILLICLLLLFVRYRNVLYIISCAMALSISISCSILFLVRENSDRRIIVSHFRGATLVSLIDGTEINHFTTFRDSISGKFLNSYIESTFSNRRDNSNLHYLDSISGLLNKNVAVAKLIEGCRVIEYENFNILMLSKPVNNQYVDFFSHYPADLVILHNFYYPILKDTAIFAPTAVIVADGSNSRMAAEGFKELYSSIHLTMEEGAYIKKY